AGARLPFALSWYPSYEPVPPPPDPLAELTRAEAYWRTWSAGCTYRGRWADAVTTSLIVLKAMTYAPTGGIVAAVTTSLPEWPGADRNWDYRFCWLRDATLTLFALMLAGFRTEAEAWREWLLRAVAGDASNLQTLYGVAGEPRLPEQTLPWLPGFLGSQPVRIGNAAADQLQLDVYGEVLDMLYQAHRIGIPADSRDGQLQRELLDVLESIWRQPDNGIWERRDGRQHFTHSKVMAWVAFDRAVRSAYGLGVEGPVERWQALRDQIHAEVCERAFDRARMTFTQSYGSRELDGSLLLLPLVGFLPARDPRMVGTVRAIERELMVDGFVRRFVPGSPAGDSAPDEGAFLACTCWLADNYELSDRHDEACALFERLLSIRNDVGLLAEQYDPNARRLLGNFPQALSHLALVNTAYNISREHMGSADHRSAGATAAGLRKGSATRQNRA
ncbi:MAG TPA: glycoside hydrolase family 15 protein, partial [Polyangia bacterium]|nr:glycoside hydrolase family 15 protein [Polyangia bacterium]